MRRTAHDESGRRVADGLLAALERRCDECDGKGGQDAGRDWMECEACAGKGCLPTDLEAAVLDFLHRHAPGRGD